MHRNITNRPSSVVVAILFALTSIGLGSVAQAQQFPLNFLNRDAIDVTTVNVPPPGSRSAEYARDFEILRGYQASRTEAECERSRFSAPVSLDTFFGPTYGPLTTAEVGALNAFMREVLADTGYFITGAKNHWARPRPYLTDTTLEPCIRREPSSAYPSGHATIARVFALVLSELYPQRTAAIVARGDRIAEDRVLGGVHHPSDIAAGRILGDRIFAKLMESTKFRTELGRHAVAERELEACAQ